MGLDGRKLSSFLYTDKKSQPIWRLARWFVWFLILKRSLAQSASRFTQLVIAVCSVRPSCPLVVFATASRRGRKEAGSKAQH